MVGISPDSLTIQFIAPDTIVSTPGGDLITHYNAPVEIQNSHYQYSPEFRFGPLGKFRVQSSANFGY